MLEFRLTAKTIALIFSAFFLAGVAAGALTHGGQQLGGYVLGPHGDYVCIANLNVVISVGEPIHVKSLRFGSVWPGQRGTLYIELENLAPVDYKVHIRCSGVRSPREGAVRVTFEPVTIVIPAGESREVEVPFSVESSAPIGIYEVVVAIYRGSEPSSALLISEVHLIGYVGGEPVRVVAISLPSLWPGSSGQVVLEVENIADTAYNLSVSVISVKGPGAAEAVSIGGGRFLVQGLSRQSIALSVEVKDSAPVGTYTISLAVRRL
ncbi:hypothetical protein B6U99_03660 [Candidatus Geothermarchaeota archaeon ex4572_27]|nr:MAG: hypothetical protein B6U99_03660 [Candidatus Geothermarchaeota archaeon ex4572_27]